MFRTFETFLVKAAENLSNKIFCLGFVRQEKPPGRQENACRPGHHVKAAAKGGPAYAKPGWPGRLGTLLISQPNVSHLGSMRHIT